jgi:hypothetical protein
MAAIPNISSSITERESLRHAMREHGAWTEEESVKRLLHRLELTGGARHRAVAVA